MRCSRTILLSIVLCCTLRLISSQDAPVITPSFAVLFPDSEVIFNCINATSVVVVWTINGASMLTLPAGVSIVNVTTLRVDMSANATMYGCADVITAQNFTFSNNATLVLAVVPNEVPMITIGDITLDGDNVTLTLSWGEPFNNFDPVVNYTVSCSGDNVTCPLNFTTTDNITRSYTITNLTSMINYTFSVVANNSIGSGEAGVVVITTPSLPDNVTEVTLTCDAVEFINQCTVDWDPITVGNGPLEQPLVYEVYYNGTRQNVTSPTTTLTFTAPSLPVDVFVDNITVIVTAINRFGRGESSEAVEFPIMNSSVTNAEVTMIIPENATNMTYSVNITLTIFEESDADTYQVTLVGNNVPNITGLVPITNGMGTVNLTGLICAVEYTIIAEGTLDGELVGPRSNYTASADSRRCPEDMTSTTTATVLMTGTVTPSMTPPVMPPDVGGSTGSDNTGAVVGGVVGGIVAAIIIIIIIIILVWYCMKKREKSRPTSPGDKVGFRPASGVKVQTLDRYGKPVPLEGDNADTGVELTGYTSKSPELTVTQIPSSTVTSTGPSTTFQGNEYEPAPSDEKNRIPSAFIPEGSYDTLAPADEPPAPSAQVIPPAQNGQSNPNAPKLNYAELEQFTRKPASVKKPEPQPSSQYAVIDPKSLQPGTYT